MFVSTMGIPVSETILHGLIKNLSTMKYTLAKAIMKLWIVNSEFYFDKNSINKARDNHFLESIVYLIIMKQSLVVFLVLMAKKIFNILRKAERLTL